MFREHFSLLFLIAFRPTVILAHGHVSGIVIAGAYYEGYQADSFPYDPNPPLVIGWTTNDKDNGFVAPAAFNTPDIICHRNATPAQGHATAAAGDVISFIWNTWPDSHVGPVFDYLAACHGPCETVDKTKLEWFKIDGASYISGADPGFWAPNVVVSNKFSWKVQLPADLAPGNYVMRHEMIALHAAQSANGAQAYPQCINLQVTGSGKNTYAGLGTLGTQLYKSDDPGIIYNIYQKTMAAYINPGPSVVAGLPTSISQGTPVITATSSASTAYITNVAATSDVASMTLLPTTQAPTTAATSAAAPTSTTVAVPTTSAKSTTTAKSTTLKTTTSAAKTTAAAATAKLYAQCGGDSWTGPTDCGTSATCKAMNNYYSQCVPA